MNVVRRVAGATLALAVIAALATYAWVRMPLLPPLPDGAARASFAFVRRAVASLPPDVEAAEQSGLPVVITLYERGKPVARGVGRATRYGDALREAVAALHADSAALATGRLKLDRIVGRGALSRMIAPLLALGAVPARDGIGGRADGREVIFTADDLMRMGSFGHWLTNGAIELALGLDPGRTLRMVTAELGKKPEALFRFRAEEHVEAAHGSLPPGEAVEARPVTCGRTPGSTLDRAAMIEAARRGGEYLLGHLGSEGRFDYEYFTVEDERVTGDGYSLPRHAGSTSFLAQLYGVLHDERVRDAAARAIDYLARQRPPGCEGERVCVGTADDRDVDLGSAALSLVAALEYARASGDLRHVPFEDGLARFLLWMQRPDGEFRHVFDPGTRRADDVTQLLYYSGEAAYALGLLLAQHEARGTTDGDAPIASALDRSLQYLTTTQYAHLAGQFYVGEDHWTCMAVDAGWRFLPAASRERYATFCDEFGRFMRRTQMLPGDAIARAMPQLAGAYGISGAIAPHDTPVGSRSESLVSIWRLGKKRGLQADDSRLAAPREQIEAGVRFMLAHQIDDDSAYLMPSPEAARGGFLMSDTERHVRIDFVQHAGSALLRAVEVL